MAYHSSITGKFVSKKFAIANPDTTVKLSHVNLRQELLKFQRWHGIDNENLVDAYLKEKENA